MAAVLQIIAALTRRFAEWVFIIIFFVARSALHISRNRVPRMALFGFPWPRFFNHKFIGRKETKFISQFFIQRDTPTIWNTVIF